MYVVLNQIGIKSHLDLYCIDQIKLKQVKLRLISFQFSSLKLKKMMAAFDLKFK